MVLEQLDIDMQINSCSHRLTPFTKINSKSITDLNVNHKTIKHLEDITWKNLDDFGYVDDFLVQHQRHDLWKKEMIKWTSLKLKSCALQKTMRRQTTHWEEIFAKDTHNWRRAIIIQNTHKFFKKIQQENEQPDSRKGQIKCVLCYCKYIKIF